MDHNGLSEKVGRIVDNVERALSGKREEILLTLAALLAGGHVLIEDVPGVGKTLLAKSLARSISGEFRRIQFTADLLPADVTGLNVYRRDKGDFEFLPGPIFANLVLADEINRTPPRTQSALLEAMEEGSVSGDGETRPLPRPFGMIATQNPVDHDGTHPLPLAQLDRFLVRLGLGYPDGEAETRMLGLGGNPAAGLPPVVGVEEFLEMQRLAGEVHAGEAFLGHLVSVVRATREHAAVRLGASPRASRALLAACRAYAAIHGRSYCVPDDVGALAPAVLSHRIALSSRDAGPDGPGEAEDVVREILGSVPATRAA